MQLLEFIMKKNKKYNILSFKVLIEACNNDIFFAICYISQYFLMLVKII